MRENIKMRMILVISTLLILGIAGTATAVPGLTGRYYANPSIYANDNWAATGTPCLTRIDPWVSFDWVPFGPDPLPCGLADYTPFSADWNGYVNIPVDGTYTFATLSDDGSIVNVNAVLAVDNGLPHPPIFRAGTPVYLTRGWYPITVKYWECCGGQAVMILAWNYPGFGSNYNIIPTENLNTINPEPNIPEFPTVALPIISVIGMLLVFHKRKQIK